MGRHVHISENREFEVFYLDRPDRDDVSLAEVRLICCFTANLGGERVSCRSLSPTTSELSDACHPVAYFVPRAAWIGQFPSRRRWLRDLKQVAHFSRLTRSTSRWNRWRASCPSHPPNDISFATRPDETGNSSAHYSGTVAVLSAGWICCLTIRALLSKGADKDKVAPKAGRCSEGRGVNYRSLSCSFTPSSVFPDWSRSCIK